METQNFKIVNTQSSINWVGKKVTGAHNGSIEIKEGNLILEDDKLVGGKFIIDTTSIKILDIADLETNAQFFGHLASDDFFSSEKYPEAILKITSVSGGNIKGDLSIKGITHPVDFQAEVNVNGESLTAVANLVIDRTKYDMKFRSGNFFTNLGDNLIYNNFELSVHITAKIA